MVDFSKLGNLSQEEREENDRKRRLEEVRKDVKSLADAATQRASFILNETYIAYDRALLPYAVMHVSALGADDEFRKAVVRPIEHESDRDFRARIDSVPIGSKIIADGRINERQWKDASGSWQSQQEFVVNIPVAPASLKPELPEGVTMPASSFQRKQDQLVVQNAQRQADIGS